MEIITTKISDLLIVKPAVFEDNRGYFFSNHIIRKSFWVRALIKILCKTTNPSR